MRKYEFDRIMKVTKIEKEGENKRHHEEIERIRKLSDQIRNERFKKNRDNSAGY